MVNLKKKMQLTIDWIYDREKERCSEVKSKK